jgi:hypothetical protein
MGVIGTFVSAGLQLAGAAQQAQAQKETAAAQAYALQYQAKVAEYNAAFASATGETAAEGVSLKGAAQKGAVRTAQAANQLDINTGTPVKVQASTEALSKEAAIATKTGYARQAYGYSEMVPLEHQEAAFAIRGGQLGAEASLLGGASAAFTDVMSGFNNIFGGGSTVMSTGSVPDYSGASASATASTGGPTVVPVAGPSPGTPSLMGF